MSDDPTTDPDPTPAPDPAADPAPTDPPQADPTDWKAMARKHEREAKRLKGLLDDAQTAAMTDQEKAINEAKAAGRAEAMTEAATTLAAAELRAAAAGAGVNLGNLPIDVARFVNDDGTVDSDGIAAMVTEFAAALPAPPPATRQPTPGVQGADPSKPSQLSRADLKSMTPEQIVEAKAAGRLNELIGAP